MIIYYIGNYLFVYYMYIYNIVIYIKFLFLFICLQRELRKVECIEDGIEMLLQYFKVYFRGYYYRVR